MIVILIPAYNAQSTIGEVVLKSRPYGRVIVYNDGSTDLTGEIASNCGAQVIAGGKNHGKGYALKKLFHAVGEALEDTFVVTIDADMQHNPADIPRLIEKIKDDGSDYAIGFRTNQSLYRGLGNRALDLLLRRKETQSGFRVYTMRAMRKIQFWADGFAADTEIVVSISDLKCSHVPVDIKYDKNSHTKNPILHFLELISYIFTKQPLVYLCVPATVVFAGSLYGFILVVDIWRQIGQLAIGTMIISMTAMVLSVITFFTGVILHVLRKPYKSVT